MEEALFIETHSTLGRRWCLLRRIERVPYS